jgi:hypothetical protein
MKDLKFGAVNQELKNMFMVLPIKDITGAKN